ncbi:MAG: tetratricopeptide repeat protein [Xanthomonadales bacterium]|nr:tetratricopeptide repeat protein [Xanthomonadales bacterium]
MQTDEATPERQLAAIWQAWNKGDAQAAVAACQALNRSHPRDAAGWHASSVIALQLGGAPPAFEFINRALEIEPGNPAWTRQQVRCLLALGQRPQALQAFDTLLASPPEDPEALAELALLAGELGRHETARDLYRLATEGDPDNGRLLYNLAATQRFLGNLGAALSNVDRALELNPNDPDAHYLRSSLKRWSPESNHVEAMQAALPVLEGNPVGEAQLCYALAKELEDCARFEESFGCLQRGARVRRRHIQYDLAEDLEFIATLAEVYDQSMLDRPADGFDSKAPIFVVGLPRTGTTLAERIISACDGVTTIGESTVFTRLVGAGAQQVNPSPQASRADLVRATRQIPFRQLGEAYIQHAAPNGGRRFVDKFPQNSLNVGAIHRALPNARIVLLERHPMDSCYAMYKALFTDIYGFSYDLSELGQYFAAHQALMRHWCERLPGKVFRLRYEDLVTDTEATARALLEYCDLPWQEQCLDFQRNRQASTTASASQVRQGIYTSSVGLWQNYRKQLQPLEQQLRDDGCMDAWPD